MGSRVDRWVGTFSEYVAWMAINCPHALVMDSWRRLELVLHDYTRNQGVEAPRISVVDIEAMIGSDPKLGNAVHDLVSDLRRFRNRVAHEHGVVSRDEAVHFAQEALRLIGAISFGRAPDDDYVPVEF